MDGATIDDSAGSSVAAAGDMNGDGKSDLIVGARYASFNGRMRSGATYVVFGTSTSSTIVVGSLGPNGFRIDGAVRATYPVRRLRDRVM